MADDYTTSFATMKRTMKTNDCEDKTVINDNVHDAQTTTTTTTGKPRKTFCHHDDINKD